MLCASCKHPLLTFDALPTPTDVKALQDLLRSSYFAPDPSHYHSQISSAPAALAQYDIEIERLQEILQGIIIDRAKLQHYIDGCRGADSSVRRLPPEILCEIFASHSPPENDSDLEDGSDECWKSAGITAEMKALSNSRMLMLSHDTTKYLHLLRTSLKRSGHHPLTLSVDLTHLPDSTSESVLELVAAHSDHWQRVSFHLPLAMLNTISHVKGRLGMLERLEMVFVESETDIVDIDLTIFETAPRLRHVRFGNLNGHPCPNLPWKQLRAFIYQYEQREDLAASLALMHHLSDPETAFEFRGFDPWGHSIPLNLPPLTSRISSFLISLGTRRKPQEAVDVLGGLLDSLTLPHLRELYFDRVRYCIPSANFWPLDQFTSLSMRSSFRNTLRTLELRDITIAEDELVASLATLVSPERPAISDRLRIFENPKHILITDELLLHLTTIPDSSELRLVPHLNYFACTSFLAFSEEIYLDFIASRIGHSGTPFQSVLRYFPEATREFEPNALTQITGAF
ncbi:hypothetical protein DFH09DRAFT_1315317 [Mycena vulgaris]|nr:hypothetical protein DFH09DRAFT_1315317 [Mycena vulgaris]